MRKLSCLLFCIFSVQNQVQADLNTKGVALPAWGADVLFQPETDKTILELKDLGANFVNIGATWFSPNVNSNSIYENTLLYSANQDSIRYQLENIKDQGMDSGLQLFLDLEDGAWRGNVSPTNPGEWFNGYEQFVTTMAGIAEDTGVKTLTIGTNLYTMEGNDAEWRNVIDSVRSVYNGEITYSTNIDSVRNLTWLDKLDVITVDAYPNTYNDISLEQRWQEYIDAVEVLSGEYGNGQPVRIDTGFRSVEGANEAPWDSWLDGDVNQELQTEAFEAILSAIEKGKVDGVALWHSDPNPDANGPSNTGYTFQNKLAEEVVRDYFHGDGVTTPSILAQPGDANLDGQFNQLDLVQVLQAGKYQTNQPAIWIDGDWNGGPGGSLSFPPLGNSRFDRLDIVAALQAGKYNTGPYTAESLSLSPVPEPTTITLILFGLILLFWIKPRV